MKKQTKAADAAVLGKSDIMGIDDLPCKKIYVEAWGGHVFIKTMSGEDLENMARYGSEIPDPVFLTMVLCDEHGHLLFTKEDADALGKKSQKAIRFIAKAALDFNGLTAEAAEEIEKN